MIHDNSEQEIEKLKKENEAFKAQRMDEDMQQHLEKMTLQKLRQELISTKSELDEAAKQIVTFN